MAKLSDSLLKAATKILATKSYNPKKDEVGKFWIVTEPSTVSTLIDVCFESDIGHIMNQGRGGLKEEKIMGVFKSQGAAQQYANKLLEVVKSVNKL